MIHAQNEKTPTLVLPVAGSAAATYAVTVDTLGYDYAMFKVIFGSSGTSATDNPSVLKIGEGTSSSYVASNYTAVSGTVGDTDWTIPVSGAASSGMTFKIGVGLKPRQRYLAYIATLGAATNNCVLVDLYRAEQTPTTASAQGVDALVLA